MGSLTSRPKITKPAAVVTSSPVRPAETKTAEEEVVAKERVETILRKNRGTFGTILTSFRGVLGSNTSAPHRKTLLGE